MNKYVELLIGLVLVIGTVYVSLPEGFGGPFGGFLWPFVKTVLIGGITIGVFLVGLLFLMIGIMDLKE